MTDKLIHSIEEKVINPEYVGVITMPMADDFVFEDFREIPDTVADVTDHFRKQTPLDYEILDCREDDGTTLESVHYSNIDFEDMSMVYLFWDVVCDGRYECHFFN